MKKIFSILVIAISIFYIGNVKAAGSVSITMSPASKTIIVGNTVTITVTVRSSTTLGSIEYVIHNDPNLSLISTNSPTRGAKTFIDFDTKGNTAASYTYTFKALSSGTAKIWVDNIVAGDDDGNELSASAGKSTITVMTQAQVYASYSGNNYLSSLGVEGYDLEPGFDRNTMEYSVKLKPETEKIVVNGSKEDGTASINGLGEITVSDGMNQIKIDVVAQNGNVRTYIINAEVTEYDPINVKADGVEYTVVRNKKAQTFNNSLFTETTVNINEVEVPAYYNETSNITVVALKNEAGEISYFIYENGTFTKFNELKLGSVDLIVKKPTTIPTDYKEDTIVVNEVEYPAYKKKDTSRFALVYGTNLVNNNEGFYVYDNFENTLQRYDEELIKDYEKELEESGKFVKLTYILAGTSIGLFILLFISLLTKPKKAKVVDGKEVELPIIKEELPETRSEIEARKEEIKEKRKNKKKNEEKNIEE